MDSSDFSRQILFQPYFAFFSPYVRETSPGTRILFRLMYLPWLLHMIPCSYWASACFAVLPSYTTFMISVRQVKVLPPASFRFHLTMDTLALGYILPAAGRLRDFHPLEYAPAWRTNSQNARRTVRRAFWYSGEVSHSGMGLPRRRYMVFLTARMIFS